MEGIIEKRRKMRSIALKKAYSFTECVSKKLRVYKSILIGSYARGDFNVWSDIDLLSIADDNLPLNPIRRFDIIIDCLSNFPSIEPIILTIDEFNNLRKKKNPVAIDADMIGIQIYPK